MDNSKKTKYVPVNGNTGKIGEGSSGGRSYSDVICNSDPVNDSQPIKVDDNVLAFMHWYDVAVVGKVVDFPALTNLKIFMREKGKVRMRIKYIGGLHIMLIFENEDERNAFVDDSVAWKQWFSTLEKWNGQSFQKERIAWLKIHGVPFNLVLNQVFDVIGTRFGKVVQPAQVSDEDVDFSYVMIGVLCNRDSRINDKVHLHWRGSLISVWVEEETGEWIPECIEELEEEVVYREDMNLDDGTDGGVFLVDQESEHIGSGENVSGHQVTGDNVSCRQRTDDVNLESGEVNDAINGSKNKDSFERNTSSFSGFMNGKGISNNNGERKIRRRFEKNSRATRSKSKSPTAQERPKKQPRNESDPFDLDRFIGIFPTSPTVEENVENLSFVTPDLNNSAYVESSDKDDHSVEVQGLRDIQQVEGGSHEARQTCFVSEETEATILVGQSLGATNIQQFEHQVLDLVNEEGFQGNFR
ncbi:hypothetical protein HanIR_Chr09g0429271 [Helianthus annuus]|nr:hypothetical protein HanIR_Chr09g0429271 [Helianthus annuus]